MSGEKIVARRYARALVSILKNGTTTPDMAAQLKLFRDKISTPGGDFACAMLYPAFSEEDRISVVDALCRSEKIHKPVEDTLKYLIQKNRIALLPQIYEAFIAEQDKALGRVRATVTTAVPLSTASEASICELLKARIQKDVLLDLVVDPSVLGGVRAQADDVVFDATLKSQLDRLKTTIAAQSL